MNPKGKPAPTPDVKAGQIWKDMDPRMTRHIKVVSLECGAPYTHDRAVVETCLPNGKTIGSSKSRIRIDRFRGSARSGFTLVSDPTRK
jgi:hypothetical protein